MNIGIVFAPKTNLYELSFEEGVDTGRSFVADEVLSGWAVGVLERRGNLLRVVTHYGYEGLLEETSLYLASDREIEQRARQECRLIKPGKVDLMSVPSVRGIVRKTLFAGSFVFVREEDEENGYRRVWTADGTCGFLPLVALGERRDSDAFLLRDRPEGYFLRQTFCREQSSEAFREEVTQWAKRYLGAQYRWGGKTTDGIDCSGLTFMSYFFCGLLIYRDAKIRSGFPVKEIPISDRKKGDLLFFPGHVAMYLGNEQYIHATAYEENFCCVINSLSKKDENYRDDLAKKLQAAGSVFV